MSFKEMELGSINKNNEAESVLKAKRILDEVLKRIKGNYPNAMKEMEKVLPPKTPDQPF